MRREQLIETADDAGFTILEMLLVMLIVSLIFAGTLQQYSISVGAASDHTIRMATQVKAQAILQTMTSELRVLGNGVPFDQPKFQIGEDPLNLPDPSVTLPIVVADTTNTKIAFRLNETGDVFLLTQTFLPATATTIHLTDTSTLSANDPIYISNSVMSGDDGLFARIASVNHGGKTITLDAASVVTNAEADFITGSILEEVSTITYESVAASQSITRNSGFGAVLLGNRSSFVLEFRESNGTVVATPLTESKLLSNLRSIKITVSVESERLLKGGTRFTASASQIVGIRNLNYFF